nr:cytochrome p450 CYP3045A1 [Brachionus angularis]
MNPTLIDLKIWLNKNLSLTKVLSLSAFGLFFLYCGKIWYSYKFFQKRNIKTPPYQFFFGNLTEIRKDKKLSKVIRQWTEKYGKTYGFYQGHTPYLVTSDLELINEIFIKQYNNFSAKKTQPLDRQDDASKQSIITATKGRWKRMRNIMNPTFSSSKMRELYPSMKLCIDKLLEKIDQNVDQEIDVMSLFKKFTMDTIWNCAFGIDRNMQYSSLGDLYIKCSDESLEDFANYSTMMYLATYFSEFRKYIVYAFLVYNHIMIKLFGEKYVDPLFWIREEVVEVVDTRQKENSKIKKRDYLQLLMDAYSKNTNSLNENQKTNFSELYLSKKLSLDEIKMNLSIFMMAGSESTSIALTVLLHVLASMPEEQEKLIHEIDDHFPNDSDIEPTYDNIQKLEYLDYIIKETLRMWPIANPACTRRCVKHTNINGIDVPENLTIIVDVLSVHYDPDLWGPVDPNVFYPLRFAQSRNSLAFMAFGLGPRNCIGIKFAMLELKMCLVKIFRKFEAKTTDNTVKELNFIEGVIGILTHKVNLQFKKRNLLNDNLN